MPGTALTKQLQDQYDPEGVTPGTAAAQPAATGLVPHAGGGSTVSGALPLEDFTSYEFGVLDTKASVTDPDADIWKKPKGARHDKYYVLTGREMKAYAPRQIETVQDFVGVNPLNYPVPTTLTFYRTRPDGGLEFYHRGTVSNPSQVQEKQRRSKTALSGLADDEMPVVRPEPGSSRMVETLADQMTRLNDDAKEREQALQAIISQKDAMIAQLMADNAELRGKCAAAESRYEQHTQLQGLRDQMKDDNQALKDELNQRNFTPDSIASMINTGLQVLGPVISSAVMSAMGNQPTPAPPMQMQQGNMPPIQQGVPPNGPQNGAPQLRPMNGQTMKI